MFYQGYYAPEDRAKRITEFLNTDQKWDMQSLHEMVTNTISALHPETAKLLLSFIDKSKLNSNEAKAYDILESWNGEHLLKSVAPTIFYKLLYRTFNNIFVDEIGNDDFQKFLNTHLFERSYPGLLNNDSSLWWDNNQTPAKETRSQIINQSYSEAIAALEKQLSPNIDEWKWEKVHTIEHVHPIGRKKPFDKIFNVGPFPIMGGQQVINNIDFRLNNEGLYKATYGPAIRNQIDMADVEAAESVLPTGESGRIMSKHYSDEAILFNTGKFRPQLMNKEEIIKSSEGHLIFK
jgi:penicillin amidase